MTLTPTHEDYIEAVYRRHARAPSGVRITDLARDLGCRLPTVTRTVRHLTDHGLLRHEARGRVHLSPAGRTLAREIAHRHDDVVAFLSEVLGLPQKQVAVDACQLEHGLSPLAAERLHAFVDYVRALPVAERRRLRAGMSRAVARGKAFGNLVRTRTHGWRG